LLFWSNAVIIEQLSFQFAGVPVMRHSGHSTEHSCAVVASAVAAYVCAYKLPTGPESYTTFSTHVQFGYTYFEICCYSFVK